MEEPVADGLCAPPRLCCTTFWCFPCALQNMSNGFKADPERWCTCTTGSVCCIAFLCSPTVALALAYDKYFTYKDRTPELPVLYLFYCGPCYVARTEYDHHARKPRIPEPMESRAPPVLKLHPNLQLSFSDADNNRIFTNVVQTVP